MPVQPISIYERIRSDISQPYYVEQFPNDGQRFVAWYLRNIASMQNHGGWRISNVALVSAQCRLLRMMFHLMI